VTNGPWGATLDNTPTFTYQGNDTDGFVVGYYVSIDQNPPTQWTTNTTWTSPELENGSHTFYVMARDDDGTNSSAVPHGFVITEVTGIIFVNGTGGDNSNDGSSWALAVKTIQRGVDLVGASGWMVLVADGTYKGDGNKNIDFGGKDIYLKSNGSAETCIINCESNGRGFYFNNGETLDAYVDGFTVMNGNAPGGGGIYVNSEASIINCRILHNVADGPSAHTSCGGGIWFPSNSKGLIANCIFDNNTAHQAGGGIFTRDGNVFVTVVNTIVRNNEAFVDGGGIYIWDTDITIDNCLVINNVADFGGGVLITQGTVARIHRTRIINNTASGTRTAGGLDWEDGASLTMTSCLIANNTALGSDGGGIYCDGGGNGSVINCTITGNIALEGGGIYVALNTNPAFINTIIWNNDALLNGREIYAANPFVMNYCNYPNNAMNASNIYNPGNITENNCYNNDPQFLAPEVNNYHLYITSPCIDAGCNSLVPVEAIADLDGNPRILNGTVDIGAYEWVTTGGNIPPGVTITGGPEGSVFGDTHLFAYKGYDADGSVAGYFVSIDIYPPDVWTTQNSWTTPAVSYGQHTFHVMSQDNLGENSSVASRSYFRISIPPTIRITGGPDGATTDNTATFTYTASDTDGTVNGYYVSVDQSPPSTWTTNAFWTTAPLSSGVHTFTVLAQDNTGTNSSVVSREFVVFNVIDTIYVNGATGDNSNDGSSWPLAVKTIQRGIDLAGASGYMVLVADGTYAGNGNKDLNLNAKNIYLKSNGGPNSCIINCELAGRGINIINGEDRTAVIDGLKIINGNFDYGGAIQASASPTIFNCIFDNNYVAGRGGAVRCSGSSMACVVRCTFTNNKTWDDGGGIAFDGTGKSTVRSCYFANNHAGLAGDWGRAGGSVWSRYSDMITLENCTILNSTTTTDGGGLWICNGVGITLIDCLVDNNTADHGGGISCGGIVTIINTIFTNNNARDTYGGGIESWESPADIMLINCLLANNSALDSGGGIYMRNNDNADIRQTTIANNKAGYGGGVYCGSPNSNYFYNSIIWNNSATQQGNQIYTTSGSVVVNLVNCDSANNALNPLNYSGTGSVVENNCINTDPAFVNVSTKNYRLSVVSPCIDTGSNTLVPLNFLYDLDGNPRIIDGAAPWDGPKVDIGAYEYQP
jgi:predicted outer membrane repeat protein